MPNLTKTAATLRVAGSVAIGFAVAGCGMGAMVKRAADGGPLPCPSSPNCVSSRDSDAAHRIEPLRYTGTAAAMQATLLQILASQPRTRVVASGPGYVHVEARSLLMRFVDDLQFWIRAEPADRGGLIDVRSASRIGYSDLGVNRARVEALRRELQAATAGAKPGAGFGEP